MSTTTVYIAVGNSDHRLSQEDWSDYSTEVDGAHLMTATTSCPRGCPNTNPDDGCKASIAIPCPLGNWQEPEPYHVTAGICRDCHCPLDECCCGEE